MKVLFDTSVLVAALVASHPAHERAFGWLKRSLEGDVTFLVAAHSTLELYAVLTRLPLSPRIGPEIARHLIETNVTAPARLIHLTAREYGEVLRRVTRLRLAGGVVYDAIIAEAARKTAADRLLTLNPADFRRVWPDAGEILTEP